VKKCEEAFACMREKREEKLTDRQDRPKQQRGKKSNRIQIVIINTTNTNK
jgi:hypothetical protein